MTSKKNTVHIVDDDTVALAFGAILNQNSATIFSDVCNSIQDNSSLLTDDNVIKNSKTHPAKKY